MGQTLSPQHRDTTLSNDDLLWIEQLSAESNSVSKHLDHETKRRALVLNQLATRIRATTWVWCFSLIGPEDLSPLTLSFAFWKPVTNRIDAVREGVYFARHCQQTGADLPGENELFTDLILEWQHFTRTIHDIKKTWTHKQLEVQDALVKNVGTDDIVYSIRPLENLVGRSAFASCGLGRRVGEPCFSPSELRLVHEVCSRLPIVLSRPSKHMSPGIARAVGRSQWYLVSLLCAGFGAASVAREAAKYIHKDANTLARYTRNIRRHESEP